MPLTHLVSQPAVLIVKVDWLTGVTAAVVVVILMISPHSPRISLDVSKPVHYLDRRTESDRWGYFF
jgi:hypothetical protein